MTWEMGFVLFVVLLMMFALVKEIARADIIVFVALVIFLMSGILTPQEALSGFSNEGMMTVALLFIIAGAIQKSGVVNQALSRMLGTPKASGIRSLFKLLIPVSGVSAFLNNTPIVVTLTPIVKEWCTKHKISPSKFLIPLSYASILGGILTLMGTSTNLVIHGLMLDRGMDGYSLFTLGLVSLPASILGIIYLVTIGQKILPDYKGMTETIEEQSREYLIEILVHDNYPFLDNPYVGLSVEEAGLRNLEGLYLVGIIRKKERIFPVKNTTKIKVNDRLIFTGLISKIADLQNRKGLQLRTGSEVSLDKLKNGNGGQLVEVVVSHQSSLLYRRLKETHFRSKFDAGVIAVHRNKERIHSKIGDIVLKPGDTLLLLAGVDFTDRAAASNDFYIVTPYKKEDHPLLNRLGDKKAWLAIGTLAAMIGLVSFDVLSMFKAMSMTVLLYLIFKIISADEAKNSIQFNVLLLIASAFGIGEAMFKTGTAEWIADHLIDVADPLGMLGILVLMYLLTSLFTEVMTNNAAAVLMFPIAVETANHTGLEPLAMIILITIAASASFLSPIGYQTNLIVYGPGGYRFTDYIKVGLPLSIIVMVTTIAMLNLFWI
ncbi:SLC13 family permease [Alteribacillus sp. HJP-4]|uniref:SLC13 family permease n=1 Tax=Alteribacillus sp. HJP-4 TaxID=2775394 RepID=UPI0035CCF2C4